MFLGHYTHTIDNKGRLTIPAKFRVELAAGAVVSCGFDRQLNLYTISTFERLAQKVQALSITRPEIRALSRLLFASASDVTLDKSNRINIPSSLRSYAGLESEAVVVGAGDHAEVWSPSGWQEKFGGVSDFAANAERFAELDLGVWPG